MRELTDLIGQQIAPFSQIENESEIPLRVLDIITERLNNTDRVSYAEILPDIHHGPHGFANICMVMEEKYAKSCMIINRMYTEWEVTDLFSAFISQAEILADAIMMKEDNNSIEMRLYTDIKDGTTFALVLSSPEDTTINYSECGKNVVESEHCENIKIVDIVFHKRIEGGNLTSMYDPYLCISDGTKEGSYTIKLPPTGYKMLIEKKIDTSTGDTSIVGLVIYRLEDNAMIQAIEDPTDKDFM